MLTFRKISIALFITALSSLSMAQTTGAGTGTGTTGAGARSGSASTPDTTMGVDSAEAREAMERAQRRDADAAVIRTDESAAQRARNAADATRDGTSSVGNRARNTDAIVGTRAPRADRN